MQVAVSFGHAAVAGMSLDDRASGYHEFHAAVARATKEVYEKGPLARPGGVPEDVARTIVRALTTKRPKPRYTVSWSAKVLLAQKRMHSDRAWDWFLRRNFPSPGPV